MSILVNKLRDGLQDTVVFLRTLGSYKIPAVIERRRKELLDRLCLLQGDSLKDTPPVPATTVDPSEEKPVKEPTSAVARDDREDSPSSTTSSTSGVTSPTRHVTRRNSKVVTGLISNFEVKHTSAKKEEEDETPKRMFQLKKVAKPSDFPATSASATKESATKENGEIEDTKSASSDKPVDKPAESADAKKDTLEVDDAGRERAASVASSAGSAEEEEEEEEGSKGKKKKKKNKKGLFNKGKGKKADKSPLPERKGSEEKYPLPDKKTPAAEDQEEEEEMELAEGVKICGVLERKQKKIGGSRKVKIDAKVFNTMLVLGGKEELELAHCSVEETDTGFKLTHPQHKSVMPFKVDGGEEEKQKWMVVLRKAIAEATPAKEDKEEAAAESPESPQHEAVPSITVEEVSSQPSKGNKRDSKALGGSKAEKKLPDQGVALKGYIHRKKPGLGRNWEKAYCVLTYQAMYFTTMQDNAEYSGMLPIYPDSEYKLSETKKGKGHDKHCQVQGLTLKMGKKLEHFSFESQTEWRDWKDAIERVLGLGGVEELLSEDEEHGDLIEEDLYEELETDFIPPVPSSPRPAHQGFPPTSQEDDIIIDEDIYEDTDDYLPSTPTTTTIITNSPSHSLPGPALPGRNPSSPAPALPGRNSIPSMAPTLPGRNPSPSPAPTLPGRNPTPSPAPTLPGRNPTPSPAPTLPGQNPSLPSSKRAGIPARPSKPALSPLEKKPAAAPTPTISTAGNDDDDDEELYDDVVVEETAEVEELYDDVVVTGEGGGAVEEELYDDVVVAEGGGAEEELYDDVVTTSGVEQDEFYEDMVPGKSPNAYVTMEKKADEGEELYVDVEEPTIKTPQKPAVAKSGTFSRMLNKKTTLSGKAAGAMSGPVSYKAPKKSKFDSKWAVVSGSTLLIHKSASDKKSQDKVPLGECKLEYGSTEAGAGKFAFHLSKGDKVYHLSFKEAGELEEWLGVVKGVVKYAPVEAIGGGGGEQEVYVAKEDHIGDTDQEITFKKGTYIRLISITSPGLWVGQKGTEDLVFEGKIGKFPADKVELAEDLYM